MLPVAKPTPVTTSGNVEEGTMPACSRFGLKEPMAGPLPHPLEIAAFVRRHGGCHALTKPHVPARNAIDIWRSCPSALTCRAEFRHAIRTFHVHITMPDGRNKAALSATRALKQVAIASMGCLLNPQPEPFE